MLLELTIHQDRANAREFLHDSDATLEEIMPVSIAASLDRGAMRGCLRAGFLYIRAGAYRRNCFAEHAAPPSAGAQWDSDRPQE
jgi:hypothetical protein